MTRAVTTSLVALCVAAAACTVPVQPAPGPDFGRLVDALLDAHARCGVVYGATPFLHVAEPQWVAALAADERASRDALVARFEREARNERVIVNRGAYENCIAVLETRDACATLADDDGQPDVCAHVLEGLQGSGDPCAQDLECSPGFFCTIQPLAPCGVCRPRSQRGDSCEQTPCAEGLVCGGELRCVSPSQAPPPPTLGDPCVPFGDSCGDVYTTGLACDFEDGDVDAYCEAVVPAALDEACDLVRWFCLDSFTTTFCDQRLAGPDGVGVCRPRAARGEPCEPFPGCDATTAVCTDGTCETPRGVGEECRPGDRATPPCGLLLTCDVDGDDDGVCVSTVVLGYTSEPPVCD